MRNKIVHSTLAAILAVGMSTVAVADKTASSTKMTEANSPKGMEKCFGITKAGFNDCGTATNAGCAGSSTVDGDKDAWLFLPKGTCSKIVGGSTSSSKSK
jgi:uncharacterized membrane protein